MIGRASDLPLTVRQHSLTKSVVTLGRLSAMWDLKGRSMKTFPALIAQPLAWAASAGTLQARPGVAGMAARQ
jgi:hypothetical protein